MKRRAVWFGVGVLCLVVLVGTAAAVPDARLTVADVSVEPGTPVAGDAVTITPTIASSVGSDEPVDIESVTASVDGEQLANETNVGALSPGDDVSVPVTTRFEEPGEYTVEIRVVGNDTNGNLVTVTRNETVVVERAGPLLEMQPEPAVDGVESPVSVTVANPTQTTLRNVVVTVAGGGIEGVIDRRVIPALNAGDERDLSFVIRPQSAGEFRLEADAAYATAAGDTGTVASTETLAVEPRDENVAVRVTSVPEVTGSDDDFDIDVPAGILDGGEEDGETADGDVFVTVSNVGNVPVSDVVLEPRAGDHTLGQRPVTADLPAGTEESVPVSLERAPASEIDFAVRYETAAETHTVTAVFDPVPQRGSVTVTGVDLAAEGDEVTISGDVGNPGAGEITGVVVAVGDADDVVPRYPGRDFFVGAVEGDGFAPFELTATVGENATHVPLEVQYLVGGDQRTETVSLPVDDVTFEPEADGRDWLPIAGVGAVIVGLLAVLGIVLYRR